MIDFSTLQGLAIPEGVVTQIESGGVVIWALANDVPVVLEVAKITSDTYASETTYTDEEFVLLDIYPKTASSTVEVTYGNVTKTLVFSGTNAQQVFFGTFNGVSDETETPASGTLTIEGGYSAFGNGTYKAYENSKSTTKRCKCITAITNTGNPNRIPDSAFGTSGVISGKAYPVFNTKDLPDSVVSIGSYAFYGCKNVTLGALPRKLKTIGDSAFGFCIRPSTLTIPATVESIGDNPFRFGAVTDNQANYLEVETGSAYYRIEGNCLIENSSNKLISGFVDSIIPNGVSAIGHYAFVDIYDLSEITIPTSVTEIATMAFWNCPYSSDFYVYLLSETPPTLASSVFRNYSYLHIVVPVGCGDTYKAATNWSEYADKIVEAS